MREVCKERGAGFLLALSVLRYMTMPLFFLGLGDSTFEAGSERRSTEITSREDHRSGWIQVERSLGMER